MYDLPSLHLEADASKRAPAEESLEMMTQQRQKSALARSYYFARCRWKSMTQFEVSSVL
jgi:hypothetical protein